MLDVSYSAPVNKLLLLGEPTERVPGNYYASLCLSPVDCDDLIRMALDPRLNYADDDAPESWAPEHAMRAVGEFKLVDAVESLTRYWEVYPDFSRDCDFLIEVFIDLGPAAIEPLARVLRNPMNSPAVRRRACDTIGEIGKRYAEARAECVGHLATTLECHAEQDEGLNAFLVNDLVNLRAMETAGLIQAAYEAEHVDEDSVGSWEDVQIDLGLRERPQIPVYSSYSPPEPRSYRSFLFDNGYHPDMTAEERAAIKRERDQRVKAAKKAKQKEKQAKKQRKLNRKR